MRRAVAALLLLTSAVAGLVTTAVVVASADPGLAAVRWGRTQLGAPYAAIDPYRVGEPLWPGGTHTGTRGDEYTFPAGTAVYDCSGFVIAAWRHAGLDLVTAAHIAGSEALAGSPLPDADPARLRPGDLVSYTPVDDVGHIVMVDHVERDGTVVTIEARPNGGVQLATLQWDRIVAMKHPTMM